jgi:hypothetical protein
VLGKNGLSQNSYIYQQMWGSSYSVMSGYGLDDCGSISGGRRECVFPHDDLKGCHPHHFLSNESVWLELKLPGREADLSNLSNSEATYVCVYIPPLIYTYLFNDVYYMVFHLPVLV